MFGRNVNMPTVLEDKLPALESNTSSDIIRKNLKALHSARKNFIQAESSERIRRALRHNVRTYADESFNNGDRVYYKRRKRSGWSGRYQDNYPPDNYPPDNYPRTNTPRTITPLGQIPPGHLPPLRNFSSTYLGILCTYTLHILFFLEDPNIHFMFHIINPFVYCK